MLPAQGFRFWWTAAWVLGVTWPAWLTALLAAAASAILAGAAGQSYGVAPASGSTAGGAAVAAQRPSPLPPHDYDILFQRAALAHLPADVDWRLLKAIAWKESNFDPRARSHAGALGMMQLMPATARHLGLNERQALDPARNIDAGARYVGEMLGYWSQVPNSPRHPERLRLALASYNWGIGNVRRRLREVGAQPPRWEAIRARAPLETRDYVHRVIEQRLAAELAKDHRPGRGPERPARLFLRRAER
ncbi:MAG: hypothetical protein EA402_01325 [Planctomycetota bacterium]|nr:MAG: hypothetical protein EA402_01325 [Planctomycetota bacterium]